ncbi:reverse transcriptase (RNA-dependent DNA polymerase) [Janthinobacterium sp. HH106]|uniref:RNA-directed DNA polymerase n=1 Tax=Janthinobacterium sp. HH106 TaxID=1537278 RepID=UPI0008931B77|nr:RNA-directed DNA polymerase [Janthinobacterium sp. HH106]OEZ80609.1 reverse transcriptase (RNA-dependent DNA polymerase) [Janthinobacterium sp. HH106]
MEEYFRFAVQNIARHGDTDVFPFPIENHVLYDEEDLVVSALLKINSDISASISDNPPIVEGMLSPVGYTGFRWATQLDPLWNAYFLGLVLSIAEKIEAARLPIEKENIFSYRLNLDSTDKTIFNKNIGWMQFQKTSIERAKKSKFVLICDIADFYPRIYHHRLENALQKATSNKSTTASIMKLLMQFSNNVSYGLPVGGPAARLLSELLLNRIDRLLITNKIKFCRFADDYHIFTNSSEDAYQALLLISEKLQENEGLLLQKTKTRIMSSEEFLSTSEFSEENEPEDEAQRASRNFLRLRLHYDPYSTTADADYDSLKMEVGKFDVVGMLAHEMRKSKIHQSLVRKLISTLRLLKPAQRDSAIVSLMENLTVLYPVYPNIMLLLKGAMNDMSEPTKEKVFTILRELLQKGSYIVSVPTHLAYTIRVLAHDASQEADEILANIYEKSNSSLIRRDIILAMANKNADFWISDVRKKFKTVTEWEQTALLVASHILGDEGEHWRKSIKSALLPMQKIAFEWSTKRFKSGNKEVPI